jgi:hypothetical protein
MAERLHPAILAEIERERAAGRALLNAIAAEDFARVVESIEALRYSIHGFARRALKAVARMPAPSTDFRLRFLSLWQNDGDALRGDSPGDFVLIDFLRVVLPPYAGPARRLFRGESGWNRRRRTYGMSWTLDRVVARSHAEAKQKRSQDGAVVLEAEVPAAAIFCAPCELETSWGEQEYMVDRRKLGAVIAIEWLIPR